MIKTFLDHKSLLCSAKMFKNYYCISELEEIGFKSIGIDVRISRRCSIYKPELICLGNHVRIDDFCLLSGDITIGNYVHISAYSALFGNGKIVLGNYCGVSPRCTLLSASDDFSGEYMISPMVPPELTHVRRAPIIMEDYSQLGTCCTVLPGVTMMEGAVTGACSLVLKNLPPWSISYGVPCMPRSSRSQQVKKLSEILNV